MKLSNRANGYLEQANNHRFGLICIVKGFKTSSSSQKYSGRYGGAELKTAESLVKKGLLEKVSADSGRLVKNGHANIYTEFVFRITPKGKTLVK